jgi:3-oxoacyl-[acyl-carrier-protein] synthase III
MMNNIKIKALEIYHPELSVHNDYFINFFEQQKDRQIGSFLEHMGRKERFVIDHDQENSLTMGIEASKRVLEKAKMSGEDIDMIVFSTQVPETTFPANAMFVHSAIAAKHETIILDSNANCAGMTVAVEQASRYMQANPHVKTALVIGSDHNTLIANPDQEITYANYGDAAAAVILEKTEEDTGFMDSIYYTNSIYSEKIKFPAEGLSNAIRNGRGKFIQWLPFDGSIALPPTYQMIATLLERNGLTPQDIKLYCFSQFALGNINKIQEQFAIQDEQIVYVGDKYGYTGTSSPFLALYEGVNNGRIQRGEYILFWTIGSGFQLIAMLFKY